MTSSPTTRVGIMGGSFDPIHVGHLIMAETVRETLALDQVLFLPTGSQPLKQGKKVTPAEHRVAMINLAIASNPAFGLSRVDVDRPGLSYTADSLAQLRRDLGDVALWFIIGSDSLLTFPKWREPARILAQARLAIYRRPNFNASMDDLEAQIPGLQASIDWIAGPLLEISATDIRNRLQAGSSIRYRVVDHVREYIMKNHLYKDEESAK